MPAVAAIARSRLRAHRVASVVITALMALGVGVVLVGFTGARRTDGALPAFVRYSHGGDAYVLFYPAVFGGTASPDLAPELAAVRKFTGVTDAQRLTNGVFLAEDSRARGGRRSLLAWIPIDEGSAAMIGRPTVVHGRLPASGAADEVVVDEELARDAALHVGSTYRLHAFTTEQSDVIVDASAEPSGVEVDARVVGVVRHPWDIRDLATPENPGGITGAHYDMYVTPALWGKAHGDIAGYNPGIGVRLAGGKAGVASFRRQAAAAFGNSTEVDTRADFLTGNGLQTAVARSISVQSRALQVFALVVAIAALMLVGQTLGRQVSLEAADNAVLRAVGMTDRDLLAATLWRVAPVAVAGAVAGAALAVGLSALTPLPGTSARRAELHPGVSADWTVLLIGAGAAAALITIVAALPGLRRSAWTTAPAETRDRVPFVTRVSGLVPRVAAAFGIRFALDPGRGRRAVPVRSALITGVVAVGAVLGAAVVSSSLAGLRHHPDRYGVTWDVAVGGFASADETTEGTKQVAAVPGIEAFAGISSMPLQINGRSVNILFVRHDRGDVGPLVVDGRRPATADEVALGGATMRSLHVHVGDTVKVGPAPDATVAFRVVGRTVLNGGRIEDAISPGNGALADYSALANVVPPDQLDAIAPQAFLVRIDRDVRRAAVMGALRKAFPDSTVDGFEPSDVTNLADVAALPAVLGGVVVVLGIGTIGHALLCAVRRRRDDLAIAKTLGCVGGQLREAMVWQALTLSVVALLVGLPLGMAAGRTSWALVTSQLNVVDHPVVPLATVALLVVGFAGLAVLLAVPAGERARRLPAAQVLRGQ